VRHGRAAGLSVLACAALCVGCRDEPPAPTATTAAVTATATVTGSASAAALTPPPCQEEPPTGAAYEAPLASDLSPRSASVAEALRALNERHPCTTKLVELGRSHLDKPVYGLAIGDGPATMFLNAVHHGDEPLSAAFVVDAARYLSSRRGRDPQVDRWLSALRIWLVPVVNPDGLDAYVDKRFAAHGLKKPGRKNARDNDGDAYFGPNDGVDLNRNYPFKWGYLGEEGSTAAYALHTFRGPSAGSEPETKAVLKLANSEVFAGSISYHIGGIALLVPYTIERVRDPKPNEAWPVARYVAGHMGKHPDAVAVPPYPVQRSLYSVDGTDQDWHRHQHGTLALLVEGALRGSAGSADTSRRAKIVSAVRSSWMALFDRYVSGPVIEGTVVDRDGDPVVAEVHVDGVDNHEGESWRTRCRDGFFARWRENDGPATLRIRLPDAEQVTERVVRVKGRTTIEVKLDVDVPRQSCPP
jgi:Zinc carboxypeptidase